MDDYHQYLIFGLVFLGLLVVSAFFSAAEIAFTSLSLARARALPEEHPGRRANLILRLKERPQHFLVMILIANNVVNIFTASLATVVATQAFGSTGLGIATGVTTFALLVFGEILPKAFAQKYHVGFLLIMAYPLFALDQLFAPLTFIVARILAVLGIRQTGKSMTEDELLALVEIGHEEGEIKAHERELIENVLEFTDTEVGEVMTPRVKVDALEQRTSVADAIDFSLSHSHSRIPIYATSLDHIIGVVTIRDLLEHRQESALAVGKLQLLKPVFTPLTRPIRALFQELTSRRIHIAIVIDEHGGMAGIVTLEDLLEELVGEIEDEEDVPETAIRELNSHTLLVLGNTLLSEIDDRLETELATGEYEGRTIAYLILAKLGRFPKQNERLRIDGVELTVEEIAKYRIHKVKISADGKK